MAKEVTINGNVFYITDAVTGRLWQEIQRITGQRKEGKIDAVTYTNENIKLLVTKMDCPTPTGEFMSITNAPDILNKILDDDVETLDVLSVAIADMLENNPYIKKKMT